MKKTLVLAIVAGMLSAGANSGGGSIYYVPTSTTTVDGDTFCGGAACTSADTIIIRGGARGGLKFQDFDGAGSYITITNENTNPDSKVEIDGKSGFGCLSLSNCKYVDLRGDNDGDLPYGIKVINDNTSKAAGSVWIYGESDHIKISYLEITCESITTPAGNGIFVQDGTLSAAWVYDTFEIHHNYIHDTGYAGMYLGQNDARENDNPYVSTFSIHDNIMEDMGAYGITFKGVHADSGVCSIYNNTVKRTGIVRDDLSDNFKFGIGGSRYYGNTYANIYGNWIEKTVGAGIQMGDQKHNIYDNIIVGCGSGNDIKYGHGIITHKGTYGINIYDNIIIQPKRYGIYNVSSEIGGVTLSRNLIGDAGLGEWAEVQRGDTIEGTGADANIYHANVADFGFSAWSDDGDYSDDDFTFGTTGNTHILTEAMGETVTMDDFTPTLVAGDTVIISPDRIAAIKLSNIIGTPGSWITFTNPSGARITISDSGTISGPMRISGCRYICLLGNNYPSETYGIRLDATGGSGCLSVVNTRDIEIAYIEMYDASHTGIGMSQCWAPWTCTEIMENVRIHHNYIHDVGGEGMYLGKSSRAVAPKFRDIQVHDNRIENVGWDGIQLGQTIGENNNVYNNIIKNTGHGGTNIHCWSTGILQTDPCPGQWFGIVINPEHYGINLYRNYIQDSYNTGIAIHSDADGPVDIHDNVVWNAGANGVGIGNAIGSSTVISNTIVGSTKYGISAPTGVTTGEIRYNLLVANGLAGINSDYSTTNDNRIVASTATENFVNAANGDFRLTTSSPARDAGIGIGYSTIDYDNNPRPQGSAPDIGAFEFPGIACLPIVQGGWELLYVDSEEMGDVDKPATNSFDGDPDTFWSTDWDSTDRPPHEIQINLNGFYDICGFRYLPRQDSGEDDENGMIKDYEFYVSNDGATWGDAVVSGTFVKDKKEKQVSFDRTLGQYVRLVAINEVEDRAWTTMAELNVLAARPDSDINDDGKVNIEDFAVLVCWWDDDSGCVEPGWCGGADFDMSRTVDMFDLAYFTENWLR